MFFGSLFTSTITSAENQPQPFMESVSRRPYLQCCILCAFFFQPVGAALLSTLEKGLGENFTSEAREAWTTVYGVVSDTMKEGAKEIQDV